ncbi:SsrA-binding protein SmpB [Patescibacteria group bacterium]
MKILARNKKANFRYQLREKFEAGIVLTGSEVKSTKAGQANINDAFVKIYQNSKNKFEAYLLNAHISKFKNTTEKKYDPKRNRKLLLNKSEIRSLIGKSNQGQQLIPISMYSKKHLLKLEFGVGKSKTNIDKRETIKKREATRRLAKLKNLKKN